MNLIRAIQYNTKTLFKKPQLVFAKIIDYYLFKLISKKTETITVKLNGSRLTIPNEIIPIIVLEEVFVFEPYRSISGLNNVLDLGGYLGESAVYLSQKNKKVSTFEADTDNFKYVKINSSRRTNITPYHFAITNSSKKTIIFYKTDKFDYGGNTEQFYGKKHKIIVKTYPISKLLKKETFDGLKMDIEGGEYDILEYFLENKIKFTFKKGYIEFHFFGKIEKNYTTLKSFLTFLEENNYDTKYYRDFKSVSRLEIERLYQRVKPKDEYIFHFYFYKKNK